MHKIRGDKSWVKKQNVVYIDNEMLGIKKNEILPLATTWMNLEGILLREISERKTLACINLATHGHD